jgi:hypothetical protein
MNTYKIKITGYPSTWLKGQIGYPMDEDSAKRQLAIYLEKLCHMRNARKVGDIEVVNATQLGRLKDQNIPFERVDNLKEERSRKYLVTEGQLKKIQENVMKESPIDVVKGDQVKLMSPVEGYDVPPETVGNVLHVDAIGTIRAEFVVGGKSIIVPINPEVDQVVKLGQQPLREGSQEKHFIWRDKSGRKMRILVINGSQRLNHMNALKLYKL